MNQQFGGKASGYLKYLIDDELAAFMNDSIPCIREHEEARKRRAGYGDIIRGHQFS